MKNVRNVHILYSAMEAAEDGESRLQMDVEARINYVKHMRFSSGIHGNEFIDCVNTFFKDIVKPIKHIDKVGKRE